MSHSINHINENKHPKQDFQVERIAFFSDAVFAIAITLLVIEFKPPFIGKDTTADVFYHELREMRFKLLAVLLSFLLIVVYWIRHHTIFKHIHNYNRRIILANMLTLLPIIFFPFTTSFLYESLSSDNGLVVIPYRIFFLNHVAAGLSMYFFYWLVMKHYKGMSYPMDKVEAFKFESRLIIMTITFLLIVFISFFSFQYSPLGVLPLLGLRFYRRFFSKKQIHVKQNNSAAHH